MPKYKVKAVKFNGTLVEETIEAPNKELAKLVLMKYKDLKRLHREVYAVSDVSEVAPFKDVKLPRKRKGLLSDVEILRIGESLRNNEDVSNEVYWRFKQEFTQIIRAAIRDLWQGVHVVTREELEQEMYVLIYLRFLPRFNPERGWLFPFIRQQVQSEIKKRWKRMKYRGADNKKNAVSRERLWRDYLYDEEVKQMPQMELSEEQKRSVYYRVCADFKRRQDEGLPIEMEERKYLFRLMAKMDMHHELLMGKKMQRKEKQILVFEQIYKFKLTEHGAAKSLGLVQSSVNDSRRRAEKNIIEAGAKLFLEE